MADDYFDTTLTAMEQLLLGTKIAVEHFNGRFHSIHGEPIAEVEIRGLWDHAVVMDSATVARLLMIPDSSSVAFGKVAEQQDGAPAGFSARFFNAYTRDDETNSLIAFMDNDGAMVSIESLYVQRIMLNVLAPKYFCTVAFGLMAITAYRHGFRKISLFAAGSGKELAADPDTLAGYDVWPKFGFDAPLMRVDLQRNALHALKDCQSVQEVLAIVPQWWADNGTPREMHFDLTADSRSWDILLDYLTAMLDKGEV